MSRCFVIQPFDSGEFDERYNDVLSPAITKAGLEPYRIDQDRGVDVLMSTIESEISASSICLADISTDNPNVWYELGFAIATGRPVIMICEEKRGKLPFDIAHRRVILYKSGSRRHFDKLEEEICKSIQQRISDNSVNLENNTSEYGNNLSKSKLSRNEVLLLSVLIEENAIPEKTMPVYSLKIQTEKLGLSAVGFGTAFRDLQNGGYIEIKEEQEYNDRYSAAIITGNGWQLIANNMQLFESREKTNKKFQAPAPSLSEDLDDDIPF